MKRRVLMPLADLGFDPSESGVPWHVLRNAGHEILFATETGAVGQADARVLDGVLLGQLGPEPEARACYEEMLQDPNFQNPMRWSDIEPSELDGLFLVGGHDKSMRPYFESEMLMKVVRHFFADEKPIGAVCHGTLLVARTIDPQTNKSVLHGRRTTCLPKYMERTAWWATAWRLGRYYRTYDAYVEEEVVKALGEDGSYERGPIHLFAKGSSTDHSATHVVRDNNYLSARWPGDVFAVGEQFRDMLDELTEAKDQCEADSSSGSRL